MVGEIGCDTLLELVLPELTESSFDKLSCCWQIAEIFCFMGGFLSGSRMSF
jgi:hypothetical protein